MSDGINLTWPDWRMGDGPMGCIWGVESLSAQAGTYLAATQAPRAWSQPVGRSPTGCKTIWPFNGPVGMNCSYRREEIWLPASHMGWIGAFWSWAKTPLSQQRDGYIYIETYINAVHFFIMIIIIKFLCALLSLSYSLFSWSLLLSS